MGFAAFLGAAGLSTLRSGSFPRWTGVVALVGAVAFLITFFTAAVGLGEDSVFGYGFLPGILALVIWSIATSLAEYRAVASSAHEPAAREADAGVP
jgi:NADH:ubiquinone oxidoreductase subunit 6 (subunit J)